MKAGRKHRVALASRAVAILRQLEKVSTGEFVFAGRARNKPLSNMAMEMVLRRMKVDNATVHGFRSSFRDWAGNVTSFPAKLPKWPWRMSLATRQNRRTAGATH
jgi:integrase